MTEYGYLGPTGGGGVAPDCFGTALSSAENTHDMWRAVIFLSTEYEDSLKDARVREMSPFFTSDIECSLDLDPVLLSDSYLPQLWQIRCQIGFLVSKRSCTVAPGC